ncbi:MAG: beta-L-arabinofuranosidase domain-containing protein [Blautia sp.]
MCWNAIELYCMGHMIEAAVAHYEVTGKTDFLEVAKKAADHIDSRFGKEKTRGIPGHEEIELALLRLFQATGETKYRDLAAYFINERGTEPNYFEVEKRRSTGHIGLWILMTGNIPRIISRYGNRTQQKDTVSGPCISIRLWRILQGS